MGPASPPEAVDQGPALAPEPSVSSALDTHKPAFGVERQDSAHIALQINPDVPVLRLRLTTFLQHLVHHGAVLSASCVNQVRPAAHGSV